VGADAIVYIRKGKETQLYKNMLEGISNGLSQIANKGNLMFENSTATRV